MQEQLINLKTAILAKEKGFDIYTGKAFIKKENQDLFYTPSYTGITDGVAYHIPTQSLLQKWLMEVHNIRVFCTFETIDDSETAWVWTIVKDNVEGHARRKDTWDFYDRITSFDGVRMKWYNDYKVALEEGLFEALKLI